LTFIKNKNLEFGNLVIGNLLEIWNLLFGIFAQTAPGLKKELSIPISSLSDPSFI